MIDLILYENRSGGDLWLSDDDLATTDSLIHQFYIALFGGNKTELDWWGNSLFFKQKKERQFSSNTERILESVALNSSGRITILNAVKSDLKYLEKQINFTTEVSIVGVDKLEILISVKDSDKKFIFAVDLIKNEVLIENIDL